MGKFLAFLMSLSVTGLKEENFIEDNTDPTWNYIDHGEDWTMAECTNTASTVYQSPWAVDTSKTIKDWSSKDTVSFLTAWTQADLSEYNYGISDYTYRINETEGNLGIFYAMDPSSADQQIVWQVSEVRFKYPSEHTIDGQQFALEM